MAVGWPAKMALWGAMVLLYCWPALWNGGPFFFPDSTNYIRAADAAVVSATGIETQWSDRIIVDKTHGRQESSRTAASPSSIISTRTVLNGRSIYYGALLYTGLAFGKFGPVLLQAAIAVATIALFLFGVSRRYRGTSCDGAIWAGLVAIGVLSPLPFFLSRLMPDAFTGLLAVSLIALLVFWDEYSRPSRAFLLAVAGASILFHSTHVLLTLGISAGAICLFWKARVAWPKALFLPAGLILLSIVGQLTFSLAVTRVLGAPPISPPFMSMRLIADGPGYAYLQSHCGEGRFALCRYLDRMPQASDTLLWSEDPKQGIFSTVADPVKRELGRQDTAFYLAVLKDRPSEVLSSMIRSTAWQTVRFELDHFNYSPAHLEAASVQLPEPTFRWVRHSAAYGGTVPVKFTVMMTIAATIASIFFIASVFTEAARRKMLNSPAIIAVSLLLLAVAANIVICGALSTPHPRYLMRIIWLLPLAVAALAAAGFAYRRPPFEPTGETAAL